MGVVWLLVVPLSTFVGWLRCDDVGMVPIGSCWLRSEEGGPSLITFDIS